MLVRKHLKLDDCSLKMDGDTGRFAGYASVFGNVDSQGDTIVAGAFDYTLRSHGKPKMFLEHAWYYASGQAAMPIGKYTVAKEDDRGLYVEGELTAGMSLAQDVRAALKHGTLDGLSIGGYVKKGDYDDTESGRVIRRWTNLVEVSVVAMPANDAARIAADSIKSDDLSEAVSDIETIRDFERFLRDAGGLSKGLVTALTSRAKIVFAQGEPADGAIDAKAAAELQAACSRLRARIPL